jgi:arylformamidase
LRIVDLSTEVQGRIPCLLFQTHPKLPLTRMETPAFINRGGRTVDQLPAESFVKSAVLLDVSGVTGEINDENLEGAEEEAGVAVREDEFVILRTGRKEISKKRRSVFAGLSENAADYLLLRGIAGVGVDSHSIDKPGTMRAHRVLLQRGILVIEDLCNLADIGESRFRLVMLPLKMNTAGSPARVIALLGES